MTTATETLTDTSGTSYVYLTGDARPDYQWMALIDHSQGTGRLATNFPPRGWADVTSQDVHERVIATIGEFYRDTYGDRITIHHADAYEMTSRWPKGTWWDVAWHDIWPTLDCDNLADYARLNRSYGRRVGWQGAWAQELLVAERRRWNR